MRTKAHKEMKSGNTESEIHIEHKRYYRRNSYQGTLILLSLKQYLDMQPEEFSKGQIIHTDEKSGCDIIMPAEVSWHRGKRIKFLKWAQILKFLYLPHQVQQRFMLYLKSYNKAAASKASPVLTSLSEVFTKK